MWFSMVTITKAGYGDVIPITYLGWCTASIIAIFGLLIIVMPITVITNNF